LFPQYFLQLDSFLTFPLGIVMTAHAMPPTPDWNELYRLAITETDVRHLPKRIADAHRAIMERIEATAREPLGNEQQRINDALHGLRVLQQEFENRLQEYGEIRRSPQSQLKINGMSESGDQNT
jgi:regulator of protease activity HflC (stomatin/prohibitin superfamily)